MSSRKHCDELLEVVEEMTKGLRAAIDGISQEHLNHVFAPHKMTIGQISVHAMAWAEYFMSEIPPWTVEK